MRTVLTLLWLVTAAIASPAYAQIETQRPEPQRTGSARIAGRVLAKDNAVPVRRALVRLQAPYIQRETETDDNGAFEFAGLPGGSYSIDVSRSNGFVALERAYRAKVGEGASVDVSVRLERTGAIVGRIVDRYREGVLGAEVWALQRREFRGHVTFMPAYGGRVSTNDLGQFRLFNLPGGEYVIVATPPPIHLDRGLRAPRRSGFVTTYYPGTQALADARRVVVSAGKDVANVDFSFASGPLARVRIDAVNSQGLPLARGASATLNIRGDVRLWSSTRQADRSETDGAFMFSDVPPGDYYLVVRTSGLEEAAYVNVRVDEDATLKVQTNAGAKISGRVVWQPAPHSHSEQALANVSVSASPPPGWGGPSYTNGASARRQGTGTFELTGLRGPMALHAQMVGATLVSIGREGGPNLAGKTVEFTGTETIDDLVVVFTTERAEVEVTLTGLREPDDPEQVLVMLFTEDAARWHAGSLRYTAIEANDEMPVQRGERAFTFRLGPVLPGRYLVAAIPNPGVLYPTDPAILERLRPIAIPVTLVATETAKAQVRVSR